MLSTTYSERIPETNGSATAPDGASPRAGWAVQVIGDGLDTAQDLTETFLFPVLRNAVKLRAKDYDTLRRGLSTRLMGCLAGLADRYEEDIYSPHPSTAGGGDPIRKAYETVGKLLDAVDLSSPEEPVDHYISRRCANLKISPCAPATEKGDWQDALGQQVLVRRGDYWAPQHVLQGVEHGEETANCLSGLFNRLLGQLSKTSVSQSYSYRVHQLQDKVFGSLLRLKEAPSESKLRCSETKLASSVGTHPHPAWKDQDLVSFALTELLLLHDTISLSGSDQPFDFTFAGGTRVWFGHAPSGALIPAPSRRADIPVLEDIGGATPDLHPKKERDDREELLRAAQSQGLSLEPLVVQRISKSGAIDVSGSFQTPDLGTARRIVRDTLVQEGYYDDLTGRHLWTEFELKFRDALPSQPTVTDPKGRRWRVVPASEFNKIPEDMEVCPT